MDRIQRVISRSLVRAYKKYNEWFDEDRFYAAIRDRSPEYVSDLIDAAMALCGHPGLEFKQRAWPDEAVEFFEIFR